MLAGLMFVVACKQNASVKAELDSVQNPLYGTPSTGAAERDPESATYSVFRDGVVYAVPLVIGRQNGDSQPPTMANGETSQENAYEQYNVFQSHPTPRNGTGEPSNCDAADHGDAVRYEDISNPVVTRPRPFGDVSGVCEVPTAGTGEVEEYRGRLDSNLYVANAPSGRPPRDAEC